MWILPAGNVSQYYLSYFRCKGYLLMHVITIKRKGLQIPNILNSVRAVCSAFFFAISVSYPRHACLKYPKHT